MEWTLRMVVTDAEFKHWYIPGEWDWQEVCKHKAQRY